MDPFIAKLVASAIAGDRPKYDECFEKSVTYDFMELKDKLIEFFVKFTRGDQEVVNSYDEITHMFEAYKNKDYTKFCEYEKMVTKCMNAFDPAFGEGESPPDEFPQDVLYALDGCLSAVRNSM